MKSGHFLNEPKFEKKRTAEVKVFSSLSTHTVFTRQWLRVDKFDLLGCFAVTKDRSGGIGVVVPVRSRFMSGERQGGKRGVENGACNDKDVGDIGTYESKL